MILLLKIRFIPSMRQLLIGYVMNILVFLIFGDSFFMGNGFSERVIYWIFLVDLLLFQDGEDYFLEVTEGYFGLVFILDEEIVSVVIVVTAEDVLHVEDFKGNAGSSYDD